MEGGSFLESLDDAARAELERLGVERRHRKGTALFRQHEPSERILLLREGNVKLVSTTPEGRDVVLALRGPGDLIGEMSAIDDAPRSATALAIDPCTTLAVGITDFRALLERQPRIGLGLARLLAERLRDADAKRVGFTGGDSVARVASRLAELAERFGEPDGEGAVAIELPLTQEELASWAGCSREAASKALQTMRGLGWLETGRRQITLLDPDAVRRRADL